MFYLRDLRIPDVIKVTTMLYTPSVLKILLLSKRPSFNIFGMTMCSFHYKLKEDNIPTELPAFNLPIFLTAVLESLQ